MRHHVLGFAAAALLPTMYENGDGVPRDPQGAALLWKRQDASVATVIDILIE